MRKTRVWERLLGVEQTVVESVKFREGDEGVLVVGVRPRGRWLRKPCCGVCGKRSPRYDAGGGIRHWRALDLGTLQAVIVGAAPRVQCAEHGVVVAAVPWARHGSGFTKGFEETVSWLATRCSKTAVSELMRVAWLTVGRIIGRVVAEAGPVAERLRGVRRLGIDEVSYRKGQRYLTVVVDHESGLLLWAAPGHDKKTLNAFFDLLGPEGCAAIEAVTADAASWIRNVVEKRCPQAALCMDPFHVVQWATEALDEVRREVWNDARRAGQQAAANELKGCRYALWKNPEDLTARQEAKLANIAKTNERLYRAYLLKEQLRQVFRLALEPAKVLLKAWVAWARRCRLRPFVTLARRIAEHRPRIESALALKLSNGLVESMNTKIRLITRQAFGFHSAEPLIGLALLALGGLCP
ncbi:MAG TPA: ISL3 family transposase, partial [Thermoanaerobaculaceae bacterium]|nr:ISL3 family transposase [Thermoanaerobaculaceae bacterium]